jgi:hypothetical protein
MRTFVLTIFLLAAQICFAQFKVAYLDKNSIPNNIQYKGNIIQAVRWKDHTGDNIVLLTATGKMLSKNAPDDSYSEAALYAYHFLISAYRCNLTWKVYDFIKECPVDLDLYFVDKTFAVTDLNKDGNAEVWLMYKNSCHGDVSPIPMKIIMYENNRKFAVRGSTKVQVSETEYMGGNFTFDDAFKNSPAVFRQYAEKLWKQHKVETWEK